MTQDKMSNVTTKVATASKPLVVYPVTLVNIMASERYYSSSSVVYATKEEMSNIAKQSNVLHYAYIYHDKDYTEKDGELVPVEPHYHLLLRTELKHTRSMIKRYIGTNQNVFTERLGDKYEAFLYLNHTNTNDEGIKQVYPFSDIVFDGDIKYWSNDVENRYDDNTAFIRDLLTLSPFELGRRYGKDFIKNYKSYIYYKSVLLYGQSTSEFDQRIPYYDGLNNDERVLLGLPKLVYDTDDDESKRSLEPSNVDIPSQQLDVDDLLFSK